MKFAIRVLNQYGTNPRDVYNVLKRKFPEVYVYEETEPYLHYHCMVEATGLNLQQVKKIMYNFKRYEVNKLVRNRNNLNVQLIENEPKYVSYMKKSNGRFYCDGDAEIERLRTIEDEQKLHNELFEEQIIAKAIEDNEVIIDECAFTD